MTHSHHSHHSPGEGFAATSELAAVVFTDAVEFSKHMHEAEAWTLAAMERDMAVMEKMAFAHNGRILKNLGDGMLLHFKSASDAVKCGIAFQEYVIKSPSAYEGRVLKHRVGIHLGDIYVSDTEVMGDSVNIASRLQSIAEPGGICISQTVYDIVKNKVALKVTSLGAQELKNIAEAIPVYRILVDAVSEGAPVEEVNRMAAARSMMREALGQRWVWLAGAALVIALLGLVVAKWPRGDESASQSQEQTAGVGPVNPSSGNEVGARFAGDPEAGESAVPRGQVVGSPGALVASNEGVHEEAQPKPGSDGPLPLLSNAQIETALSGRRIRLGRIFNIERSENIKRSSIAAIHRRGLVRVEDAGGETLYRGTYVFVYKNRLKDKSYRATLEYDEARKVKSTRIVGPL
jgi:class 3 adenylate cyclase